MHMQTHYENKQISNCKNNANEQNNYMHTLYSYTSDDHLGYNLRVGEALYSEMGTRVSITEILYTWMYCCTDNSPEGIFAAYNTYIHVQVTKCTLYK